VQALVSYVKYWAAVGCAVAREYVPTRGQWEMGWCEAYRLVQRSVANRPDEKDELPLVSDCGRGVSGRLQRITGPSEQTALGLSSCALAALRSKRRESANVKQCTRGSLEANCVEPMRRLARVYQQREERRGGGSRRAEGYVIA
jgi:hypothetical protein